MVNRWSTCFFVGVLLILFASSASGVEHLAFRTILSNDEVIAVGNEAGQNNWYSNSFGLDNVISSLPALLLFEVNEVNDKYNFVTINADGQERNQINSGNYRSASASRNFVGSILPHPQSDGWSLVVLRVPENLLRNKNNVLGIHSRTDSGNPSGNTDDFKVTRAFLLYFSSSP